MIARFAAAALTALLLAAPAGAAPNDARLAQVRTFAFAIGAGMLDGDLAAKFAGYDLVVADGEEIRADQVDALHAGGALVLGYLSVGTIERWRSWYPLVKRYRLDFWGDWGEWYAQVAQPGYRAVIAGTVAPALLAKGLDGLFLDNVDMIADHPRQRTGMYTLVASLSAIVRGGGGLLFAQNGEGVIDPLLPALDGWNREDVTWTYDFDGRRYRRVGARARRAATDALRRIGDAGLLVTATDYTKAANPAARDESVASACAAGAVPFVSDIGLSRLPVPPLSCP